MPQLPGLPEDHVAQVEWFHMLSKTLEAEEVVVIEPTLQDDLARFVARQLPAHPLRSELTDAQFIDAVLSLRKNESSWNRALMQAIIKACDLAESGQPKQAAEDLKIFATTCPWIMFTEIAINQAALFPA
jgi:hypothetical protein